MIRPGGNRSAAGASLAPAVPAALAALAEAGLFYVPIHLVARDSAGTTAGPFASYVLFAPMFVAAVALATAFRRSPAAQAGVPVALLVIGSVEGSRWGVGTFEAVGVGVVLAGFVALRVVTLAVREWREPVGESFAVGTVVLLAEAMAASRTSEFAGLMPILVTVFFLGSLASRTASVWLVARPIRASRGASASPTRRLGHLAALLAVLVAGMGVAFALGGPGGGFQVSGGLVYRLVAWAIGLLGYAIAALLLPVAWVLRKLDISFEPFQRLAQNLKGIPTDASRETPGGPPWERIVGFIAFLLIFLVLLRAIRRQWKLLKAEEQRAEPEPEPDRIYVPRRTRKPRVPRLHRELPADTVRRWYAEALLALERLGLPKSPSRTPGEYLPVVAGAFPESARGFTALTRAYEQVRYGSIALDREAVRRLEVERDAAMEALGRARRIDDRDQA